MAESYAETTKGADVSPPCILVAEDDEGLRAFLISVLESQGYRVLSASDGAQALRVAEQRTQEIGLLLSDICMPGVTGVELARLLTGSQPHIKVILMSGTETGSLAMEAGWDFIRKPFSSHSLLEVVRQSLAGMGD